MDDMQQIEAIIQEMLSNNEDREEAEKIYLKMVEESTYDIIYFHIQYILQNLQNNDNIRRGLTLLSRILSEDEVYSLFTPDQNEFIQTNLLEMFLTPGFDENNLNFILDIVDMAQRGYNYCDESSNFVYRWTSIFEFCINLSQSDNSLISSLGIELISRFIKYGTFNVDENEDFLNMIIQKVLSSENFFPQQAVSTINLISESFTENDSFKQYAPNIIEILQNVPPDIIKKFVISVYLIPINFFSLSEALPQYISTITTMLESSDYPNDVKYYLIENIETFSMSNNHNQLLDDDEIIITIIQSISNLFTLVELDEDLFLTKVTKSLLLNMSKNFDSKFFDKNCLNLAAQNIENENWTVRFSGLSIFDAISTEIEEKRLIKKVPLFVALIGDPSELCRMTVYKTLKRISVYKKDVFSSELSELFFEALLDSMQKETNPEIAIYGFKVLSKFCDNSGSEILEKYCEVILQLCSYCSTQENIFLQIYIIECLKCLCKSMMTHLCDYYPQIKEYIINMASVEEPLIRCSVISCIPQICKILPESNLERIELAQFGISLFLESNQIDEFFTDYQQMTLIFSFIKLVKITGFDDDQTFQTIIDFILRMASEKLEFEIVKDTEVDVRMLPKGSKIIKQHFCTANMKHIVMIYSQNKLNEIMDSFIILKKLIYLVPNKFDTIKDNLLNVIVESTELFVSSYRPILLCIEAIIEKSDDMNIECIKILDVINEISKNVQVGQINEITPLMKFIIKQFKDPESIQPLIEIANGIVEKLKNEKIEIKEEHEEFKGKEGCEDNILAIASYYEKERINECEVAQFYSVLIKNFPQIVDEEFVNYVRSLFQDDEYFLSLMIVETRIQSLTTKDFEFVLSNSENYIVESKECLFTIDLLSIIIKSTENHDVWQVIGPVLLKFFDFDDNFLDENPDYVSHALYCSALLFQRFPDSINEDSLGNFIEFLPDDGFQYLFVNKTFALQIVENSDFFVSDENLTLTLKIIAKSCNGSFIDSETREIYKQFMKSIFEQIQSNELIQSAFGELDENLAERLRNLV